ncbi:MAG: Na-Ca exchanger/integrin-beta4 [Candidatus Uhrbacteria bacterium GW2011_GWF2_41_16]|uniref:Na-Ca exchanger/integrin-beta4 n=1 Tax=Candidatus Uhrbacteria bacterium GW2011_GWF2_41_16 TaxID=1618997 RepID=A0A0G0YB25_9BACT|nr:MAG: Na-Ca exchanger/integrin-beta4 [Candidatus Uhrbacteria bacterium GW2011_GWF2_41_16]
MNAARQYYLFGSIVVSLFLATSCQKAALFDDYVIATIMDPTPQVIVIEPTQEPDLDGDGFSVSEGDCDDTNAAINPNAIEIAYDGIDQDCEDGDLRLWSKAVRIAMTKIRPFVRVPPKFVTDWTTTVTGSLIWTLSTRPAISWTKMATPTAVLRAQHAPSSCPMERHPTAGIVMTRLRRSTRTQSRLHAALIRIATGTISPAIILTMTAMDMRKSTGIVMTRMRLYTPGPQRSATTSTTTATKQSTRT